MRIAGVLLGLTLLALPLHARAEEASLEISLQDRQGEPMAGVELEIVPGDYHGRKAVGTSDEQGLCHLATVRPGPYKLRFRGREIFSLEVEGIEDGNRTAWQLTGIFDPASAPSLPIGDGQRVVGVAVLVEPGAAVERDPASFRSSLDRLTEIVQQGGCADAAPRLERHLDEFPHHAKAAYLLGFCLASTGRPDEGVVALERAHGINPEMPGVALLLGQVLVQLGRTGEAGGWLRKEAPAAGIRQALADAWLALGSVENGRGNDDAAIEAFEQVLELAPDRPEPYAELARLYAASDDRDRLVRILRRGAEAGRVDIEPLLNLGLDRLRDEQFADADAIFEQAAELAIDDESRAMAFALLGRSLLRQQRRDDGISMLRRSLELDGDGRFASECRKILDDLGT